MLNFIDTHAHLNSKQFDADLRKVITSSKKAGISNIIIPGFDLPTSIKSVEIAKKYRDYCFGTVGIHPYHANKVYDLYETRETMEAILRDGKDYVVAIGEVGLDYHLYNNEEAKGKKDQQKELLKIEIELALKHNLPMVLHCRNAWDDYIEILSHYKNDGLRGVSHCFEGGKIYLQKIVSLGLYVGVNGLATFNERIKEVIQDIPTDRLLLETDSPFLAPEPLRGRRNIPKNIRLVAKQIAIGKGETLDKIASITTENAKRLFHLN